MEIYDSDVTVFDQHLKDSTKGGASLNIDNSASKSDSESDDGSNTAAAQPK